MIIEENLGKIQQFAEIILKESFSLCHNEDLFILSAGQHINREAYAIKCLIQHISGMLKN